MPRPPKNQRTIFDLVLEDQVLAEALQDCLDNEEAARLYRDARQRIKARLNNEHPEAINAKTTDGRDQWVVADGFRFVAKTAARPAGKKVPAAGTSWRLEAFAIADEAAAPPPPTAETMRMSVDGQDGQIVKRPRRSRSNGAAAEQPVSAAAIVISEDGDAAAEVDDQLSPIAQSLLDEARRAPADEDEAQQQAEAAHRLAHASQ